MPKIAAVNIVGPEGDPVAAGQDIPEAWPDWFVEDLLRSGGAVDTDAVDEEDPE